MSSSRLKDEAAEEQYRQCVETYIDVLDSAKFLSLSSESHVCNKHFCFCFFKVVFFLKIFLDDPSKEKIAQHYVAFILQLLKCTQRPSKMKLAQACVDVFSVGKTEASKFAGAIVQVFQEARGKLKGYKTGEKLSQPFKRICEKMLELSCTGDENVEDSQSQSLKALPVASSSFSTQEGPRRTLKEQLSIHCFNFFGKSESFQGQREVFFVFMLGFEK